jgi:uncharacterized lipoprotein YddW (UPF0748 family)
MVLCAVTVTAVAVPAPAAAAAAGTKLSRGVWVTVFSEKKVHFSKKSALELVSFCADNGIDTIYLQIYRAGEAWYDSRVAGRKRYEAMVAAAGSDPIDLLIDEAGKRGINVHGWLNVLSLAQNTDAPIVRKYGRGVLTRDQRGRLPLKCNQGEDQIFLEPGDERVVRFTIALIGEVMDRYPSLSGIHLDYIRYPKAAPPGGLLFLREPGVSYGFAERNVARFKLAAGKNPWEDPGSREWDAWKKQQVTGLLEKIRAAVKKGAPAWKLSCAVVPSPEKAAATSAQEWPQWLKRGTVDYVVLMNYTRDVNAFIEAARLASAIGDAAQIHVGIAVYMLKNMTWILQKKLQRLEALNPGGIVFFAYDDICRKGISNVLNGSPASLKTDDAQKRTKTRPAKRAKKAKKKK